MKKKWTLISVLGVLTPLTIVTPILATSCATKHKVQLIEKEPVIVDNDQIATDQTFDDWLTEINKLDTKQKLSTFFAEKGSLTPKIIASIAVSNADQSQQFANEDTFKRNQINVTVTLNEGYLFKGDNQKNTKDKTFNTEIITNATKVDVEALKFADKIDLTQKSIADWKKDVFDAADTNKRLSLLFKDYASILTADKIDSITIQAGPGPETEQKQVAVTITIKMKLGIVIFSKGRTTPIWTTVNVYPTANPPKS